MATEKEVWQALKAVADPELPVISVVDLGVIRKVEVAGEAVRIAMTPTFSGCPAWDVMRREVEAAVRRLGPAEVSVETVLHPPWSSDWISAEGRARLRELGLAPPPRHSGRPEVAFLEPARCPDCGSERTTLTNAFGSGLCRALYVCQACGQPFERFKPL
ncbi:MAG: 1,2-phenylacetyl-CoA epoxidase subunit PaaD [Candidatus Promineifilaceae bacterium]